METQNLVEDLNKTGIRSAEYKHPPTGRHVFALTILPRHTEGVVTVNQGRAKINIYGDKKRRQAVVTVREPGREVKRSRNYEIIQKIKPSDSEILEVLKNHFPVIMPQGTHWSISNPRAVNTYAFDKTRWHVSGLVTARVKRYTTNHFLIGMDESRNFISPLPRKVTSVGEAHLVLRPKRLRKTSIRQGEWFFTPCTKKQSEMLNRIATSDSSRVREYRLGRTTHTAKSSIRTRGGRKGFTYYARGYITDNRTGHHKSLFLTKWHKVVKNKEATIKVDPAQRRQRATWD